MPPTSGAERGRLKEINKDGETQQAKHDGWHGGQVVDVDLDYICPAIDCGANSSR